MTERPEPRRRHEVGKLSTRLAALSVLLTCALGLGALISAITMRRWTDTLAQRRAARLTAIELGDLRLAYSDEEGGLRGYILTGNETFLEPYKRFATVERSSLDRLATQLAGRLKERQLLAETTAAAERWRMQAAAAIAQRRAGILPTSQALDVGNASFDSLRRPLEQLDTSLRARAQRADDEAQRIQHLALGGAATTLAIALLSGAVVTVLFRWWVAKPMAEIAAAARAIGRGERTAMPRLKAAELRDVSGAVEFLQQSLSDARDRAVRAYDGLEQSAVLALQVRSELADQHGPAPAGWELVSTMRAAEGLVAGDCYDIGLANETTWYIVMIDVTGHGATAALHALKAKSLLRTAVRSGLAPGDAMSWLAHHRGHERDNEYLTAWVSLVDVATGDCSYANAGHPPALLVADATIAELGATGPLIGPFQASWTTEHARLQAGSTLVVHTDGLTDAVGPDRERLGERRVRESVSAARARGARATVDALIRLVDEYRLSPLLDDMSVVALYRAPIDAAAPDVGRLAAAGSQRLTSDRALATFAIEDEL